MGEKIFFPNSAQFDKMNENLEMIARAIGVQVDISTWEGIQKAVRVGIAPEILPIGTQLLVNHSKYGNKPYVVVAHDYFKSTTDNKAHTMSLMSLDAFDLVQYDASEAFYYANAELPAGTYNFTLTRAYLSWEAGTYQFTLTKPLPAGGQLSIGSDADSALTAKTVRSHENRTTFQTLDVVPIEVGDAGTSLGVFGVALNDASRVSFGSNNYKESAIRQFLNSSAVAGSVWTPQTQFDRPPSWLNGRDGFMNGFDEDFIAVIGDVIVPCATNSTYEAPDSTTSVGTKYTVNDKFYLASQREIFGTSSDMVEDGTALLPYFVNAINADRVKYKEGAAVVWRTRTPYSWNAEKTHRVSVDGSRGGGYSTDAYGVSVICTVV